MIGFLTFVLVMGALVLLAIKLPPWCSRHFNDLAPLGRYLREDARAVVLHYKWWRMRRKMRTQ